MLRDPNYRSKSVRKGLGEKDPRQIDLEEAIAAYEATCQCSGYGFIMTSIKCPVCYPKVNKQSNPYYCKQCGSTRSCDVCQEGITGAP